MSLVLKRESNNFEMTPAGLFDAVCTQIIDLGTQQSNYSDGVKSQRKVRITWEIVNELMQDNRPFVISKEYGFTLHEKSSLSKDLISWRGKNFTEDELEGFNLSKILGLACQLNIIHTYNETTKKTYAKISAIVNKNKNFKCEKTFNELLEFDLDNYNHEIFEKLPEFLQEKIKKSPEYTKNVLGLEVVSNKNVVEDEEIPF
jgi:hypothetical protein